MGRGAGIGSVKGTLAYMIQSKAVKLLVFVLESPRSYAEWAKVLPVVGLETLEVKVIAREAVIMPYSPNGNACTPWSLVPCAFHYHFIVLCSNYQAGTEAIRQSKNDYYRNWYQD